MSQCLGHALRLAALIEFLPRDRAAIEQSLRPNQVGLRSIEGRFFTSQRGDSSTEHGDLVIDLLDRRLELPPLAAGHAKSRSHLGFGSLEVGLGVIHGRLLDVHLYLERLSIELDQQVSLPHAIVVIDINLADLAGDARCNKSHVAVDEGVIGRNRVQGRLHDRRHEITSNPQSCHGPYPEEGLPPSLR
jgi:hypothetical protein